MSYVSDWREAEEQWAYAEAYNLEHYPDCTQKRTCPAEAHRLSCLRWRAERYPAVYGPNPPVVQAQKKKHGG